MYIYYLSDFLRICLYVITFISLSLLPHDTENKEAESKEGSLEQVEGRGLVLFIFGVPQSKLLQKAERKGGDEGILVWCCNRKRDKEMKWGEKRIL